MLVLDCHEYKRVACGRGAFRNGQVLKLRKNTMKKIIVALATFYIINITALTNAEKGEILPEHEPTIGFLVMHSDAAGVGLRLSLPLNEEGGATVQVDSALFGCTNQQLMVIESVWGMVIDDAEKFIINEGGRFVFCIYTNTYDMKTGDWSVDFSQRKGGPEDYPELFKFADDECSWFLPDADDGLVFTHLTNVIRVARTERNWTNYYEVCRDAVNSPSKRVKNDARHDLRELLKYASPDHLLYMQSDPLFPNMSNW